MVRIILYIAVIALLLPVPCAGAQENPAPRFFSVMQDVPLMPGMSEIPEMALIFDKPEGRIIESAAMLEAVGAAQAEAFYAQTLPQLGWKPREKNIYTRQGEELVLSIEGTVLRVMVRPAG